MKLGNSVNESHSHLHTFHTFSYSLTLVWMSRLLSGILVRHSFGRLPELNWNPWSQQTLFLLLKQTNIFQVRWHPRNMYHWSGSQNKSLYMCWCYCMHPHRASWNVCLTTVGIYGCISIHYATHVKTHKLLQVCKQVVTNLFTSCRQVVFALLVPSCCHKFGTSC
jgi:hypothetical protein